MYIISEAVNIIILGVYLKYKLLVIWNWILAVNNYIKLVFWFPFSHLNYRDDEGRLIFFSIIKHNEVKQTDKFILLISYFLRRRIIISPYKMFESSI